VICFHFQAAFTEGQSDERPIVLQDVKSIDFEHMVWMSYNSWFFNPFTYKNVYSSGWNRKYSEYIASAEEWSSIISLAHRWQFEHIREAAIQRLCCTPECITSGEDCHEPQV